MESELELTVSTVEILNRVDSKYSGDLNRVDSKYSGDLK